MENLQQQITALHDRIQSTPLKSEVALKSDVASRKELNAIIQRLGGNESGGGQILMTNHDEARGSETLAADVIALKKGLAQAQAQANLITNQIGLQQERLATLEQSQS